MSNNLIEFNRSNNELQFKSGDSIFLNAKSIFGTEDEDKILEMASKFHPNEIEVRFIVNQLIDNGFVLTGVDNGGDEVSTNDPATIVQEILSVDEASLYFYDPENPSKKCYYFIVLGNEDGVAINDYSILNDKVDTIAESVYAAFNNMD
jgi:hypothetical protein